MFFCKIGNRACVSMPERTVDVIVPRRLGILFLLIRQDMCRWRMQRIDRLLWILQAIGHGIELSSESAKVRCSRDLSLGCDGACQKSCQRFRSVGLELGLSAYPTQGNRQSVHITFIAYSCASMCGSTCLYLC